MELGKNISRIRKLHKITAAELAKLAGIKQPYLTQIEKGKRSPSLDVLQRIAKALNTTVSELLGEVPDPMSDDMKRLIDMARGLSTEQIDAIISVVRELGGKYGHNK